MLKPSQVLTSDPEILGGESVFAGTRVPVRNLLDYLAAGDTIADFLAQFPSVSEEQAKAALELAWRALTVSVSSTR